MNNNWYENLTKSQTIFSYIIVLILPFVTMGLHASNIEKPKIIKEQITDKFTSYSVEGNLKSNNPIKCIPLKDTLNTLTPADLFTGVADCLKKDKFENTIHLLYMARLYGAYDSERIADKTAGQGIIVLQMNTFSQADKETTEKFQKYANSPENKKRTLATVCAHAKEIGPPNYYPKYMILHGMKAFIGIKGDGLKAEFNSNTIWNALLDKSCKNK